MAKSDADKSADRYAKKQNKAEVPKAPKKVVSKKKK